MTFFLTFFTILSVTFSHLAGYAEQILERDRVIDLLKDANYKMETEIDTLKELFAKAQAAQQVAEQQRDIVQEKLNAAKQKISDLEVECDGFRKKVRTASLSETLDIDSFKLHDYSIKEKIHHP